MDFFTVVVLALVALVALVGCAGLDTREPPPVVEEGPGDAVALRLAAAAGRAEEALGRLSRIEASVAPIEWSAPAELVPEELMVPVSIDWTGPVAEFASRLATLAGYKFVVVGAAPVQPVIVDVHARERPLIAVFRETGFQAGTRTLVTVDARWRIVEVVHRGQ